MPEPYEFELLVKSSLQLSAPVQISIEVDRDTGANGFEPCAVSPEWDQLGAVGEWKRFGLTNLHQAKQGEQAFVDLILKTSRGSQVDLLLFCILVGTEEGNRANAFSHPLARPQSLRIAPESNGYLHFRFPQFPLP